MRGGPRGSPRNLSQCWAGSINEILRASGSAGSSYRFTELFFQSAGRHMLQPPRLIVEALQRRQLFLAPKLRRLHGRFQHADRFVIDLERHRVGVSVLAAVGE